MHYFSAPRGALLAIGFTLSDAAWRVIIIGRWIGIDYGTRRTGLALADAGGRLASPAGLLPTTGHLAQDARRILDWCAQNEAGGLVVGLPLNMDGSDSAQTRLARALANELRRQSALPVELWDERLTTFQADQTLQEAGLRPARRRQLRDALAAQVLLQSFLDARRPSADSPPADP
ncbi:MAG: Holliday junction resolvase RuvX [Planctomycetota bacterium]